MSSGRDEARSCLASNAAWRRESAALRDQATQRHLEPEVRLTLLRQADAAERQADWWLNAAIDAG